MLKDAKKAGIMYDQNLDMNIRSLRETLIYGLKGMAAYSHHAHVLGFYDDYVNNFFYKAFASTIDDKTNC